MTQGITVARYAIRVRNASRQIVGEVDAYNRLGMTLRFNSVGDWALELAADHPQAANLVTPGYGVEIVRSVVNPDTGVVVASRVELSGPVRRIERHKDGNVLLVSGRSDDCWLAARDAWPVLNYPYGAYALALPGLLRYYRLGESVGTSAADAKSSQNGTYTNTGWTLAQAALIDDADTSVSFDGTGGYVELPTTSLPTGNTAFWMAAWVNATSWSDSGGFKFACEFGSVNGAGSCAWLGVNSSGHPATGNFGGSPNLVASGVTWGTGETHLLMVTWDGTTRKLYADGALATSDTPAAFAITLSACRIAKGNSSSTAFFWNGRLDDVMFGGTSLPTDPQIAQLYALGLSRFASAAYDTQSGACETVLKHYVDVNAGPGAIANRQVSGLTIQTDAGSGSVVKGNARFDALVNKDGTGILQQLALASSPPLGFRVVQSGTALQFQVYTPADKTAVAKFSDDLGNLADFDYVREAPDFDAGGNYVVVGGSGQLTARQFVNAQNATSIANWGRDEFFVDARDTADRTTLLQRAADALAQTQEKLSFSATLAPVQSMVYGVDYSLGDKVTIVVDGVSYQDIIREVAITLDNGSGSGGELVVPSVGTPNAAVVLDTLASFARLLRQQQARIDRLERTQ